MDKLTDKIRANAEKFPDDIEKAVDAVERWAKRNWSEFDDWKDELIRSQFRNMIHDARHGTNVQMRRAAREYGGAAKVVPGAAVAGVNASLYMYLIDGRTLGSLLGSELSDLAAAERARANGHGFNAKLLEQLRPLIEDDQMVLDIVSEDRLRKAFKKAEG